MFFSRRRREQQASSKEAAGENLYTKAFSEKLRTQVFYAFRTACQGQYELNEAMTKASTLLKEDEGVFYLTDPNAGATQDLFEHSQRCSDDDFPGVVEALSLGLATPGQSGYGGNWRAFEQAVNELLREHRVSYEMVDGRLVPFESRALHVGVTSPLLTLLGGRRDLAHVEQAFQNALKQVSEGHPDNAITDAATALQEYLTSLGCSGSTLQPLMESARSKGLLGAHDAPLAAGMLKLTDWVNADRVAKGDAHHATHPTADDALLAIHVVGAIILRLSKGPRS